MPKLMIVEDEGLLCFYLARIFEEEGMQVLACTSGEDALQRGPLFNPDLLLTDWLLTGQLHGLALARELKKSNTRLKTIIVSGLPLDQISREASPGEVLAFIAKPFELDEMEALIRAALAPAESSIEKAGALDGYFGP